ncbi:MAG: chromosome segregation protein SMC [Candidatus Parabeggiatoa sp. nov. 3]|nr:MAG: chromosome segregation protein SMC [Gammaproteobacteria bacterium]
MLKKIRIRSFKSILNQEVTLGMMNVFIGANGSGKSNFLEAIGMLSAAAAGRVDDEALQRRGIRLGTPRLYKSAFEEKIPPHLFFEAQTDTAKYAVSLNNSLENPKPAWQYQTEELVCNQETIVNRGPLRDIKNKEQGLAALKLVESDENSEVALLINLLRNFAVYTPNTPILRGIMPDQQTREPVGLSGGRLAEALKELQSLVSKNEFIEEAFDDILSLIDWINALDTTSNVNTLLSSAIARPKNVIRFTDRFMKGRTHHLTAYDASEGALYILFCAVLALSPNSPYCLAIDNLDQTLNPRLSLNLTRLLCQWITEGDDKRQIFFTVHNPAVLDGLALQDDRIRLFTVDRNNRGHTEISRVIITEEIVALSHQKGWPLSRLWVMGHLGGVTNV